MITNFKYWLTLSKKWNPVVYIKYTSKNGNDKQVYGYNAVRLCRWMYRSKQIDKSTLFNINSIKKTTDEAFLLNNPK